MLSRIIRSIVILFSGLFCMFLLSCASNIIESEHNQNADNDQEVADSMGDYEATTEEADNSIKWRAFGMAGKYTGQIDNNKPDGYGVWVSSEWSSMIYKGNWVNGEIHGQGIITYRATDIGQNRYTGGWYKGKWHGRGEYISADGYIIEGSWENNDLVFLRSKSDEHVSHEIKNKVNSIKNTSKYIHDPLLNNLGLSRKEILDKNGSPNRIIPYYYGLAISIDGSAFDYYCYDKYNACFMFMSDWKIVTTILLSSGAKFLGTELGKTTYEEISSLLGEPEFDGFGDLGKNAYYKLKGTGNDNDIIGIFFVGNENDDYPSRAEIRFTWDALIFIDEARN